MLRATGTLLLVLWSVAAFALTPDLSKVSLRLTDWAYEHQGSRQTCTVGIQLESPVDVVSLDRYLYSRRASLVERSQQVQQALRQAAASTQPAFLNSLRMMPGVDLSRVRTFWVGNVVFVDATADAVLALSLNPAVSYIDFDAQLAWDEPVSMNVLPTDNSRAIPGGREPGLDAIGAPTMWSMGYTGLGRIAFGIDTGVDAGHPALGYKWQGNFKPADQAWFDDQGNYPTVTDCGGSTHGTHTMGTVLGLDPNTQDTIGVAWGARWIASPGICSGNSTSERIAAFQWAMDPDGDPTTTSDMPDAICNSWWDPNTVNECNGLYRTTLDAVEAAGIAVVFSAGNSGSNASTITLPKNLNNDTVSVYCVGATQKTAPYNIAGFSSRGPSTCGGNGTLLIKPEVSAPGVDVRSAIGGGGYAEYSGTSMAAPHVTGAILLLKEAFPYLTGRQVKLALYHSAVDLGAAGEDNDYGMGLINVPAAYQYLLNQGHVPAVYANDAGVNSVDQPLASTCDPNVGPSVTIANQGTSAMTSLTIEYGYPPAAMSTYNWTGNLAPGATTTVNLPASTLAPGDYTLLVVLSNPNNQPDERAYNDCIYYDFAVRSNIQFSGSDTVVCGSNAQLTAIPPLPGATVHWYDQPNSAVPFFTGMTYSAAMTNSTTWYVDAEYTGNVGAVDNNIGGGGNFQNDAQYLIFNARQDFTLKSVLVYSGTSGNRTIELRNAAGQVVQQLTTNIPGGSSRVTLNFNVPTGNDYQLGINGNVNLFRNNSGPSYPYVIADVVEITTSSAGPDFYYFYYDWEVEYSNACGREPVTVTVSGSPYAAAIGQSATTVNLTVSNTVDFTDQTVPTPSSWFWDFGNGIQNLAQNPTASYSTPGTYTVMMIAEPNSPCPDTAYTTVEVISAVGIEDDLASAVEVFPNPAGDLVKVKLGDLAGLPVQMTLFNALGERVAEVRAENQAGQVLPLDLSQLAPGAYFLHVRVEDQVCVKQIRHQ